MSTNLDPVTLTVIQNGLIQVCNEMDLAFVRAAFSPVISEGMDRSDGIYDAVDGSLIAQGAALTTGEQRLTMLIDRYGAGVVKQAIAEMRHRAERQMRAKIAGIPDG